MLLHVCSMYELETVDQHISCISFIKMLYLQLIVLPPGGQKIILVGLNKWFSWRSLTALNHSWFAKTMISNLPISAVFSGRQGCLHSCGSFSIFVQKWPQTFKCPWKVVHRCGGEIIGMNIWDNRSRLFKVSGMFYSCQLWSVSCKPPVSLLL